MEESVLGRLSRNDEVFPGRQLSAFGVISACLDFRHLSTNPNMKIFYVSFFVTWQTSKSPKLGFSPNNTPAFSAAMVLLTGLKPLCHVFLRKLPPVYSGFLGCRYVQGTWVSPDASP